jgi:hypothetical protein
VPDRPPLPRELVRALRARRRVEQAATRLDQRERAIHATADLMLAAVDAGWRVIEAVYPAEILSRKSSVSNPAVPRSTRNPNTGSSSTLRA